MDHEQLRTMLSAYLDGELTPGEQQEIAAHLVQCPACRELLRELKQTQVHLRGLDPVTPPPWLTARIMDRVRAEARRPSGWRRRFRVHRSWIPLEAAALVILCASGYLLYRAVATDPTALLPRATTGRSVPAAAPQIELPPAEKPHAADSAAERAGAVDRTGTDAGARSTPSGAKAPESMHEGRVPVPGSAMPVPEPLSDGERGMAEHKAAPAPRLLEGPQASVLGSALREKQGAAEVVVLLGVADRQTAVSGIAALTRELHGKVVARVKTAAGESISVSIDGGRLERFLRGLARFGTLQEPQATPAPGEGAVLVRILLVNGDDSSR